MADTCSKKVDLAEAKNQFVKHRQQHPINHPIENQYLQRYGNEVYHVAVASMQGKRESMEDAHTVVLDMPNHPNCSFFAVFDGHNGRSASHWCSTNVVDGLSTLEHFLPANIQSKTIHLDQQYWTETKDETAGATAVFTIFQRFSDDSEIPSHLIKKCDPSQFIHLTIGNMGDSRLIVGNSKTRKISPMTTDHKPGMPEECQRIKDAGGIVNGNRIDAKLAVSRAMGDHQYKQNPALPPEKQKIIAVPDITEIWISSDDVVLICCDGIFERFSNDDAMNFIFDRLESQPDTAKILSEMLYEGVERGTKDNMTAMIIQNKNGKEFQAPDEFVVGMYYIMGNNVYDAAFKENVKMYGKEFAEVQKLFESRKEAISEEKKRRKEKRANVDIHIGQNNDEDDDSGKTAPKSGTETSNTDSPKRSLRSEATKGKLVVGVSQPASTPPPPSSSNNNNSPVPKTHNFPGWKSSTSGNPPINSNTVSSNSTSIGNSSNGNVIPIITTNSAEEDDQNKKTNSNNGKEHTKKNSRGGNDSDEEKDTDHLDPNGQERRRVSKGAQLSAAIPSTISKRAFLKGSKTEVRQTIDGSSTGENPSEVSPVATNKRKALGRSKSNGAKTVKVSKVTITTTASTDDSIVITVKPKKSKKPEI